MLRPPNAPTRSHADAAGHAPHPHRHRRLEPAAHYRRRLSRRRHSFATLCQGVELRRNQLVVLSQPPRRSLCALGTPDTARIPVRSKATARDHSRAAVARGARTAAELHCGSLRTQRPAGRRAGSTTTLSDIRATASAQILRLAFRDVRWRSGVRATPRQLVRTRCRSVANSSARRPGRSGSSALAGRGAAWRLAWSGR